MHGLNGQTIKQVVKQNVLDQWELSARPTGKVTGKKILELVRIQEFRCALTNRKLTPETASLDHIVPFAAGGEHVMENVQIVHSAVNVAKGTLTMDEFLSVCRDVVRHCG